LNDACEKGDLEKVKIILLNNPSLLNEGLNEYGFTALLLACCYNDSSIVSYLLEQEDIDVNKSNKVNDDCWCFSFFGLLFFFKLL
jgi:ankyrin repeat protein